jgi:hypothetical protein
MSLDKHERRFERCVHCGVYTIWKVKGFPICRSCAKQLEADPTRHNDKSDEPSRD